MKRKVAAAKYHIEIVLCIVCMILLSACSKAQMEQIVFGDAQVVRVDCESQSGSGVIYAASEGYVVVVTAAHVLDGAETVTVVWESTAVDADTIARVAGLDLAFLKIERADAQQTIVQSQQKSDVDQVILRGYNASGEVLEVTGTVSEPWIFVEDFGCHMMVAKAATVPGMSGGGVFYNDGKFAGIICGTDESGNVAILPANVILSEYGAIFGE